MNAHTVLYMAGMLAFYYVGQQMIMHPLIHTSTTLHTPLTVHTLSPSPLTVHILSSPSPHHSVHTLASSPSLHHTSPPPHHHTTPSTPPITLTVIRKDGEVSGSHVERPVSHQLKAAWSNCEHIRRRLQVDQRPVGWRKLSMWIMKKEVINGGREN